jgi:hypothetical protein
MSLKAKGWPAGASHVSLKLQAVLPLLLLELTLLRRHKHMSLRMKAPQGLSACR